MGIKTIAIVGRPNVGKSSLFNVFINRREALTSPNPGLTRDRSYSYFFPEGNFKYLLIDTGGLMLGTDKDIEEKVNMQVEVAIEEADLLLFVTDAKDGLTPMDEEIAGNLRKTDTPIILVVNKSDIPNMDVAAADFYKLGFNEVVSISAIHKRNIAGLTESIIGILGESNEEKSDSSYLKLCIAGKPNVGKSTLLNLLAGEQRVIVDKVPGTTRNPAKCYLKIEDIDWEITDLAGVSRRKRGKEVEEIISMLASRREIERADICIFMLDLTEPLTFQDCRIAGWIIDSGTSVIIAGNKEDCIEDKSDNEELYRENLLNVMPFMWFAPLILLSAKEGKGINRLYKELKKVVQSTFTEIPQHELDMLLTKMISKRPPPESANKRPIVVKLKQKRVNPPVFNLFIKHHRIDKIPQHWKNYIRNSIYKHYEYYGAPVKVNFVGKPLKK